MKKAAAILCVISLSLVTAGMVWAAPVAFEETFLGSKTDDNFFQMAEKSLLPLEGVGNEAGFFFDLTGQGGQAELLSKGDVIRTETFPTTDETGYDPDLFQAPFFGYINFFISDWDNDDPVVKEKVRIKIEDGIQTKTFTIDLENDADGIKRAQVELDPIVLAALGDGKLFTLAIAPAAVIGGIDIDNTFSIEKVKMHVEANPVPIPATILLLGPALIGLLRIRSKAT
jgi:hypothetical protein